MFKKLINKFFNKKNYGVSFDNKIKLTELPKEDISQRKSIFYNLNKDLSVFEITRITKNPNLICFIEVGTDNEFVVEQDLFEYLFTNIPIPKEIEF